MNVERLHRILIDLNEEITANNYLGLLQQIQQHLQNQINQPNQPSHQTNLVNTLNTLYEKLESSKYNTFSPSWKQIISEIKGENLFGIELKDKLQDIFASNTITPANALEELKKIHTNIQSFHTAIKNILSGFSVLKIGREDLMPGECEFGYVIPREYTKSKLLSLKKELGELNFILSHIAESISEKEVDFKVKTISSSDFLLYIIIGLTLADYLSRIIERILNNYKTILEIKTLRNQLKQKGVPEEETKGIESWVNNLMDQEIKKLADEIIQDYKGEKNRKNELRNALIIALNKLANRIDKGFNVEIRIQPLPEPEEETDETKKQVDIINKIQERAKKIEFIETKGESILSLPETNEK